MDVGGGNYSPKKKLCSEKTFTFAPLCSFTVEKYMPFGGIFIPQYWMTNVCEENAWTCL